ncbi:Glycerol-3-phosphate dehydrogenase [NAD(P)+] [Defluviimonas aquaemixtae]|uniref:Glycerol-3-phosphate dehydrogenase [NAD(P)+] n=1 Tax=Albidovulum aquaemixtae TaxID=1542388 RepID=A0A2R8BJL5_9RHOB|nr:NAD(P)H-dependent glycerol-3-phosphate dehydrogenase [Defluviimonas aquaemixtae]SPH23502.1 Glycerol-3-phosphate dehydrogenase [NAD(P)+] [Defluviimonas aquaemixtae]
MSVAVLGAGAFGTALAIALARHDADVTLWARDTDVVRLMSRDRQNERRLPGVRFPARLAITSEIGTVASEIVLLTVPMQQLAGFLTFHSATLNGRILVSCAKGIDLATQRGATDIISAACPEAQIAVLTGPSFAADIARGLPTALTLACRDDRTGAALQEALSTPVLRLYLSSDVRGAELGGALKNVIAIAAGVVVGAGLGDSARAALMTRGFAEMNRLAIRLGAQSETLAGLSGFGDLVLTCTSDGSRNFRYGRALGAAEKFDPQTTVEGAATAKAVSILAKTLDLEMPIAAMVAALVDRKISISDAMSQLLSRPLRKE